MWVVFQKSDSRIVGTTPDSDVDPDKAAALEEVVRGLADAQSLDSYDALRIETRGRLEGLWQAIAMGQAFVRSAKDGTLEAVVETPETYGLALSTDAKESHPVDGAALIPGDGESFVTVLIAKVDGQGKPMERKKDNDTLWLRTDHGTLRDDKGENEIRSIKLTSGKASLRLYSEKAKRLATVHVFNADPYLRDTAVRVEFT
jgi:hypothetical protein